MGIGGGGWHVARIARKLGRPRTYRALVGSTENVPTARQARIRSDPAALENPMRLRARS